MRVLVVDDNATNRRIQVEMLRNWRMEPDDRARSRRSAFGPARGACAGQPFALVLTDANMPRGRRILAGSGDQGGRLI